MPLPPEHLASLQRLLASHETEIAALRDTFNKLSREIDRRRAGQWTDPNPKPEGIPGLENQLELIGREIKAHDLLLEFGRNRRLVDALGELVDSREIALEAAANPRAFASSRGVELPPNLEVDVIVRPEAVEVRATYFDELAPAVILWDETGFSMPWQSSLAAQPRQ
jgi:hypothetical protein